MTPPSTSARNPFDPARLRLPARASGVVATRPRLPRHRRGEAFLKGPIPYAWVSTACRLPGSGLRVALGVRFLRGRYGGSSGGASGRSAAGLGLSESTTRRGLHAAEEAGLVVAAREPGCKPSLAVVGATERDGHPDRPPLYGPIPASWLLPALKLPGRPCRSRWPAGSRRAAKGRRSSSSPWANGASWASPARRRAGASTPCVRLAWSPSHPGPARVRSFSSSINRRRRLSPRRPSRRVRVGRSAPSADTQST